MCLALAGGCDDGDEPAAEGADAAAGDMAGGDMAGADMGPVIGPCGDSPESVRDCVDVAAYGAALDFVAQPRPPGSAHWQAVQDRCADAFEAAGFAVERHAYGSGVNVIGVKPGVTTPQERIVVSAHYDHLGECAGADDNGTGVAGVIEAARVLGQVAFERTVVVACWDEEEFGKYGSQSYVARAKAAGDQITASYVFEMLGYRDAAPNTQLLPQNFELLFPEPAAALAARNNAGDFMAVITHEGSAPSNAAFLAQAEAVGLPTLPIVIPENLRLDGSLSQLRRSDHEAFWENDYPAMMLTDTANYRNPGYHCSRGQDDIASVDVDFAILTVQAAVGAVAELAGIDTSGRAAAPLTPPPTTPLTAECDPIAQDCPDGARCTLVSTGGWHETCVAPAAEGAGTGEPCVRDGEGGDSCAPGHLCALWGLPRSDPQQRTCRLLCRVDGDCPADENCIRLGGVTDTGACARRCNPLEDDCPERTRCVHLRNAEHGRNATYCLPAEGAGPGEPCPNGNCTSGLCLAASGTAESVCSPYCRVGEGGCAEGLACYPVVPQAGLPEGTIQCLQAR
ncbi:MAG: M20/M25/M40 family metallo-hydrolase [Myxococcales bacterium]|nr:M20/M25/M40 family metallo-hydrolase [Myxococcales bacterium]